jgi:FlaA1/EpsC-like NDP-sugar epimerase
MLSNWYFIAIDAVLTLAAFLVSLMLRFEFNNVGYFLKGVWLLIPFAMLIRPAVLYLTGIYRRIWRYATTRDYYLLAGAIFIGSVFLAIVAVFLYPKYVYTLPRSLLILEGLLNFLFLGGFRIALRQRVRFLGKLPSEKSDNGKARRALIAGAGSAGEMVAREMYNSHYVSSMVVGFVDDDPRKKGAIIHGITVLGSLSEIPSLVEKYDIEEVIIAMPSAPGNVIRQVVALCKQVNVHSRTVPGLYEILLGRVGIDRLRRVEIEDLLRRSPVPVDTENLTRMISGKKVLISGAGGSIGSELSRQIVSLHPKQLVLLGHGENSIFNLSLKLGSIAQEFRGNPKTDIRPVIGDIRDLLRMKAIFTRFSPEIVFHAAAHKHVPLMEDNPEEAVTNNVLGTRNLVEVSQQANVFHFVLISTDKAVNPTSVMGMTKQLAEKIVRQAACLSGKSYVAVRFGNVLGSRGSVISIIQEQIAAGGPVTITHPEVARFIMTVSEAAYLVLQAAAMGKGGEVFVLNMGEPVKIVDLVGDMIELSGYRPGIDIETVYTGLRPGEKLNEELFVANEQPVRTEHEKIFVAKNERDGIDNELDQAIEDLITLARSGNQEETRAKLSLLMKK